MSTCLVCLGKYRPLTKGKVEENTICLGCKKHLIKCTFCDEVSKHYQFNDGKMKLVLPSNEKTTYHCCDDCALFLEKDCEICPSCLMDTSNKNMEGCLCDEENLSKKVYLLKYTPIRNVRTIMRKRQKDVFKAYIDAKKELEETDQGEDYSNMPSLEE